MSESYLEPQCLSSFPHPPGLQKKRKEMDILNYESNSQDNFESKNVRIILEATVSYKLNFDQ